MKIRCDLSVLCDYYFTLDDGYGLRMQAFYTPIVSWQANDEFKTGYYNLQQYFVRPVCFDFEDIFGFAIVTPLTTVSHQTKYRNN